jgi:hypothetical protein
MIRRSLVLALALLASAPAVAQEAEKAAGKDVVIVTGKQAEEAIKSFVGEVAARSARENQFARWDRTICPSVVGFPVSYAQPLIDQIARRAFDVGLDVDKPGCAANILIIVSKDPDGVARALNDNYRSRLGMHDYAAKTAGRNALKRFVGSDAAVRWWNVNVTAAAGSGVAPRGGQAMGTEAPVIRTTGPTLLRRNTQQAAAMSFIIVDSRRLDRMNLSTLADYLAMASLAQIDPEADTSAYPSILNLFDEKRDANSKPSSLTEWDLAYLKGLYGAQRDAVSDTAQAGEIARSMKKDLTPGP